MSVYLTAFREFYVCTACKNVVRDEKGCCPHCGNTVSRVRVVGRAIVESTGFPGLPCEHVLEFFPKGEEPHDIQAVLKKYQRADWGQIVMTGALAFFVFTAGVVCGIVAML